jgi:hypothetical protein
VSTARIKVDGAHALYHYLQKDLSRKDIWLFQMLAARLVVSLGVWLPPEVYRSLPVLLPFAVRDPESRGNSRRGVPDQWGSPSAKGLLRDDNSLIKNLPRSLRIQSAGNPHYHGKRLGNGFVACHVWRRLVDSGLASRDERTYSFVPNLVWLPVQVAELTDREGSFVQVYVQAVARKIFAGVKVSDSLRPMVESIWSKLPAAPGVPAQGLPDVNDLNFFSPDHPWMDRRRRVIAEVISGLETVRNGGRPEKKIICTRYTAGLPRIPADKALQLLVRLKGYAEATEPRASKATSVRAATSPRPERRRAER